MGERAGEREEMEGKGQGEKEGEKGEGGRKIMRAGGGRSLQILDQNSQVSSSFLSVVTQGSL